MYIITSDLTRMLEDRGVNVFYGQKKENLTKDIDLVVYTEDVEKRNKILYIINISKGLRTENSCKLYSVFLC